MHLKSLQIPLFIIFFGTGCSTHIYACMSELQLSINGALCAKKCILNALQSTLDTVVLSLSRQRSGLWRQIILSETTFSNLSRVLKATSNQWWPGEVSIVLKGHWFGHPDWQEICMWKVNARTLPSSSPVLRVLEQSPQLVCLIVTAPGWVQCTELIFTVYFQRRFFTHLLGLSWIS